MYFLLAGLIDRFIYLKIGLAVVLIFVGIKMLLSDVYKLPIWVSLSVIATCITIAVRTPASARPDSHRGTPRPPGERARQRFLSARGACSDDPSSSRTACGGGLRLSRPSTGPAPPARA